MSFLIFLLTTCILFLVHLSFFFINFVLAIDRGLTDAEKDKMIAKLKNFKSQITVDPAFEHQMNLALSDLLASKQAGDSAVCSSIPLLFVLYSYSELVSDSAVYSLSFLSGFIYSSSLRALTLIHILSISMRVLSPPSKVVSCFVLTFARL